MEDGQGPPAYSTDKLNQVLEQIWQNNQILERSLECPEQQGQGGLADPVSALISLSEDLSSVLRQKLSYAKDTLQTTSQLLNALHHKQLGTLGAPLDYLARISEVLVDAVTHLGETEKRLHEASSAFEETFTDSDGVTSDQHENNDKEAEKEEEDETKEELPDEKQLHHENTPTTDQQIDNTPKMLPSEKERNETDHDIPVTTNGCPATQEEVETSETPLHQTESESNKLPDSQHAQQKDSNRTNEFTEEKDYIEATTHQANNGNPAVDPISGTRHASKNTPARPASGGSKGKESNISQKEFLALEDGEDDAKVACYITAPNATLQRLTCRILNDMSPLVVADSEELVSNVISIERMDLTTRVRFPVNLAIPFSSRYRGSYRDIMVKVYDDSFHSSYLTPVSLEGHGTHKGSFAEVKVYKFGIFSVVSCLKKETFTVPRKGFSLKPNVDSRISLNYPPGSFNTSVIVQLKVQPIDASLISALKVKNDVLHSLVSTSPLIYTQHPSSQQFLKPVTVILPCPPNPEKKRLGEDTEQGRVASATGPNDSATPESRASVRKHGDHIKEYLKVLGFHNKEDQWTVLDDIVAKNLQKGFVSFDLLEHFDSFIVLRLSSAMDNAHLIQFIRKLQEATQSTTVNVVMYRNNEDAHRVMVQVVPTKDLNMEIVSLREKGFTGPPEPSEKIALHEGEQIIFNFRGNICASGTGDGSGKPWKLTFHSQRKQRLELQLQVVDEFGNYGSPYYKGTAVFYKLTKEDIAKTYGSPIAPEDYDQHLTTVCRLPLMLPKYEKIIIRPPSRKRISNDSSDVLWDKLLYWLSEELSEDDASALAVSLPVRRSTIQLIKLKSPDNLTDQIYELLNYWKTHLPTCADKLRLLCRHLTKSGRSDLAEELKHMWENKVFPGQPQHRLSVSYMNA